MKPVEGRGQPGETLLIIAVDLAKVFSGNAEVDILVCSNRLIKVFIIPETISSAVG